MPPLTNVDDDRTSTDTDDEALTPRERRLDRAKCAVVIALYTWIALTTLLLGLLWFRPTTAATVPPAVPAPTSDDAMEARAREKSEHQETARAAADAAGNAESSRSAAAIAAQHAESSRAAAATAAQHAVTLLEDTRKTLAEQSRAFDTFQRSLVNEFVKHSKSPVDLLTTEVQNLAIKVDGFSALVDRSRQDQRVALVLESANDTAYPAYQDVCLALLDQGWSTSAGHYRLGVFTVADQHVQPRLTFAPPTADIQATIRGLTAPRPGKGNIVGALRFQPEEIFGKPVAGERRRCIVVIDSQHDAPEKPEGNWDGIELNVIRVQSSQQLQQREQSEWDTLRREVNWSRFCLQHWGVAIPTLDPTRLDKFKQQLMYYTLRLARP